VRQTFTLLDAFVVVAYLSLTTGLGMYVGRKQKDAKDYFVADRNIPWWAVLSRSSRARRAR
jgi:solute:Na+ symporter, SSS family